MFLLGKISKSRGNRGEVIFQVSHEIDISSIDFSGTFELRSKKHSKTTKMESYSQSGSSLVAKFDISNSINDALRLVGYEVYIRDLAKGSSIPDIMGYSVSDLNGINLGVIINFDFTGQNKLIVVYDGIDYIMVPFNDSIVIEIDEIEKMVILDPPEGLMELNKG